MFLDTISRVCPKTTLQGAHLGNPWYEEAAEAARWNPNLYFDVTGSTLLKFIKLGRLERLSEILWWASGEAAENPHTLKGGPGAWEAVLHVSYIDLDSGVFHGGKFWRLTPMVNWHLSDNVRIDLEYGYGELDRFGLVGATQFLQGRIQFTL